MSIPTDSMRLVRRLAYWLRFRSQQDDLREELEFHREMLASDLERRGLSPEEARVSARRVMGNETYMREEARGVWLSTTLEAVLKDIRYAWRGLRRSPVFTTVAVLTLAICIGANTAIFTVVHRVLLAPLPYPDANRIVRLDANPASDANLRGLALYPDVVRAWATRSRTVEDLVASTSNVVRIGADSTSPRVPAAWVTPSFLTLLRTPPALGRGFTACRCTERSTARGDDRLRVLADALRQRDGRRWEGHHDQWCFAHDRRGDGESCADADSIPGAHRRLDAAESRLGRRSAGCRCPACARV
jgi:hypothetical protein